MAPDLSIVVPTLNRCQLLERNLQALRDGLRCQAEIIVVDGGSTDGTLSVLDRARGLMGDRLKIIREAVRGGFVRAANLGFRSATGRNLMWLNDDARPLPGALDLAVQQIDAAPANIAFLALFHRFHGEKNVAYETIHDGRPYRLCHVRGTLYANFAIGRRETFAALGYFDERFFLNAADPDLSLKAWDAGLRVEPAHGAFIDHDQHTDDRRLEDSARAQEDNRRLFEKWDLPPKNHHRNDFDPSHPCTLRGLRAAARPRVTFLISTYNRREALLRTLDRLQAISKSPAFSAETIIVDNASTDGTAKAVARQFPAVRLLRMATNRGACAKNAGLQLATGQFIILLDDDSHPAADSIPRMIEHFRADPRLGAALFDVILPDGSHECSAYPTVFVGCGAGFRREAICAAGGLPDDFFMQAEEYDLSLRLMNAGWRIGRFDDLRVHHLKTPGARIAARTTRLDVRNNLLVIARRFPRQWVLPFAIDWMRRYRWIAQSKGRRHRLAFWHGLAQGLIWCFDRRRRSPVSADVFERFAMIETLRARMAEAVAGSGHRSIVLIDIGKNIFPYWLAARAAGLRIVAIADPRLAKPGRRYRGIPVLDDAATRRLPFDAAVIANTSTVHAAARRAVWWGADGRPVFDLLDHPDAASLAA